MYKKTSRNTSPESEMGDSWQNWDWKIRLFLCSKISWSSRILLLIQTLFSISRRRYSLWAPYGDCSEYFTQNGFKSAESTGQPGQLLGSWLQGLGWRAMRANVTDPVALSETNLPLFARTSTTNVNKLACSWYNGRNGNKHAKKKLQYN